MFQLVDATVPLAPLVPGLSPLAFSPLRALRSHEEVQLPDSPTPLPSGDRHLRESLTRYSQDGHAGGQSASEHSVGLSEHSLPTYATYHSLALSSQSTKLSIASVQSSPCPAPRQRQVSMLTSHSDRWLGFRVLLDNNRDEDRPEPAGHAPRRSLSPESTPSEQGAVIQPATSCSPPQACRPLLASEPYRLHRLFAKEAAMELERSLSLWPDTNFSLEMVARAS